MLASAKATCLFVVDGNGTASGIVTDRDFAIKVAAEASPLDLPVTKIMSSPVISIEGRDGMKIRLGEQFYRVVNPGVPVPRETVVVHHLRSEDLQGCEPPAKTLEELRQFVANAVLVGHFVNIDLSVL